MIEFLSNGIDIFNKILRIINSAYEFVILISPYWILDLGNDDFMCFKEALNSVSKSVHIIVVVRKDNNNGDDEELIREKLGYRVKSAKVHFLKVERLHAKFYANENDCLITSFNMYEASIKNVEIGVFVDDYKSDVELYKSIIHFIKSLNSEYKWHYLIKNRLHLYCN